jgi:lysophospholipase L1-like esterase
MSDARWLALGDSYTAGEGVSPAERWPERVASELRQRGRALAEPRIVARTGWTAEKLLRGMEEAGVWPARERWDVVSLLIGVIDQYKGHTLEQFAPAFAECLERAVSLAGGDSARVVVISIPDWGVTPFAAGRDRTAIARALDEYNAHVLAVAGARGARTRDLVPFSRSDDARAAEVAGDGLHPGPEAHAEWARLLAPSIAGALQGRIAQA